MLLKLFLELYPTFKDKSQLYTNYTFIVAKYLHDMYFKKFIMDCLLA